MTELGNKITYPGEYYHVYNRGNRRQDIFLAEDDYIDYLNRIRKYKDDHEISLICYCLMPNHFHLLLRQNSEIPIYKFMASIHTGYSMHFNRKYNKVGHLFQGKCKHKRINSDEYILHLSSYIHLNPFIDGLVKKIEDYQWSSYPDYIDKRQGTLCDKEIILRGGKVEKYRKIVEEESKEKLIMRQVQKGLNIIECP